MSASPQISESADLTALFEPIDLRGLQLPNRVLMAPMEKNLCTSDGVITQRYIDYRDPSASLAAIERVIKAPTAAQRTEIKHIVLSKY